MTRQNYITQKRQSRFLAFVGTTLTIILHSLPGEALTLNRNFISAGDLGYGDWQAGEASTNVTGGGNLIDIFNAAADFWEQAILDDYTIDLNFGWSADAGDALGVNGSYFYPSTGRVTRSSIIFNNFSTSWFLDPTPYDNEEYNTFKESFADLGGGVVNTGRVYTNPITGARGFDLFSVALHEIGHSLGVLGLPAYQEDTQDGDIDITSPRPYAGTAIPISTQGSHLDIRSTNMYPYLSPNQRKDISAVDILANAEISNFTQLNLNPRDLERHTVPEPGVTFWFIGLMLGTGYHLKTQQD